MNNSIDDNTKYVSFQAWAGGFSNIRLSYELIGAISVITGRTIILPPKVDCLFLSNDSSNKDGFFDMFDILDKEKFTSEFNCIDFEDVPEYQEFGNDIDYFHGIEEKIKCIYKPLPDGSDIKTTPLIHGDLFYNNITDYADYNIFASDRTGICIESDDKFIHFPYHMIGDFFYHIYAPTLDMRNDIKNKVKNGIVYRQEFFDKAKSIYEKFEGFGAIHIRRNDFLYAGIGEANYQLDNLIDDIKSDIKIGRALYIATDEKDKSIFKQLTDVYDVYFLDSFYKDVTDIEALCIDQIVCSEANVFLGSGSSTYTHYIHILRGYNGKPDYHRRGTNYDYGNLNYIKYPWESESYDWQILWDSYWVEEEYNSGFSIGIHGSHNAAIAVSKDKTILEVVELERWCGIKNAAFWLCGPHLVPGNAIENAREINDYFKKKYSINKYDGVFHNSCSPELLSVFQCSSMFHIPHHLAHAANAMYQSDSKDVLNISFDGGSEMGFFFIHLLSKNGLVEQVYQGNRDLAVSYSTTAHYLKEIKQEKEIWLGNLTYSGKVMGYSAYGEVDEELLKKYRIFYEGQNNDDIPTAHDRFQKIFEISPTDRIEGELAKNMARTNQMVFEQMFSDIVNRFIDFYKNYGGVEREVQFSGGGSMNILNNTIYDAFVTPNSDDRGIALGCLLYGIKPTEVIDSTYLGSEPFGDLPEHKEYSVNEVVQNLIDGEILGVIQGRAEHGARALGNRSIICLPKKGMKEILNKEVKNREAFRPFAPMCTLEDAPTYFEFGKHSRWMTHNAIVKDGFEEELGAIIHNDGTARLQTVTNEQNEFMYKILTKLKELGYPPVILNTSFNVQGKPMISTYKEAISIRDNTGLHKVITDKFILL
jgi:carbamoyltransferase